MKSLVLFLFVVLVAVATRARAKITDAEVTMEDRLLVPLDEPYGFGPGGGINLTISGFHLHTLFDREKQEGHSPDVHNMGIMITTPYGGVVMEEEVIEKSLCPLDSQEQITLLRFDEIQVGDEFIDRSYSLAAMIEQYSGGEFILYFANCEANTAVDFDITLSLFNQKGDKVDYLPVGMDALPFLYFVAFIVFTSMAVMWCLTVVRAKQGAHTIHWLMFGLVVLRALTVLSQSGMYHMISVFGHPEGWNIAFYVFTAMRSVLFFSVVVLIAAGWSYMKPFLSEREKQILLLVVPLQVFANVAIVVIDETTPASRNWFSWRDIWHVIDILCCCAILFPIVWSIRQMRENAEHDDKAARVLSKLVLFRQFYISVVSYIYFTRIIVYLLDATLTYQLIWISALANEVATVLFFVFCGLQFRPVVGGMNPYFTLDTEEEMELIGQSSARSH